MTPEQEYNEVHEQLDDAYDRLDAAIDSNDEMTELHINAELEELEYRIDRLSIELYTGF